jgi:hypothetical protein
MGSNTRVRVESGDVTDIGLKPWVFIDVDKRADRLAVS